MVIMATRRHGSLTAFWNAAAGLNAGANSSVVEVGRNVENMTIFLTSSGAATAKVQVGHSGADVAGMSPDTGPAGSTSPAAAPYDAWFDLYYAGSAAGNLMQIVLAGAGSAALAIPDFGPGWLRLNLVAGTAVTVTAGFEVSGD